MSEYKQLASSIIENVGGKENVLGLKHCVTRLRFTLADESKANDDILKNMDGVVTIMKAMGQYMVVIGEHVPYVYKEVASQLGFEAENPNGKKEEAKKKGIFNTILGYVSGALGPCLGILCAAGVIKGFTTICTLLGLPTDSGIYMLLNAAGDGFFYFMPLFLGYTAGKKFGIDPFTGMLIAAAMTYPSLQNVPVDVFGFSVTAKYQGAFFPILISIAIAAPLYKFLDKRIPTIVRTFMVPALTLVIMFPISFMIIGPVVSTVAAFIPTIIYAIMNVSPVLTCALLGGLWQVLVLFGIHGTVSIVEFTNLMMGSPSVMLAATSFASFAQIGVVAAIFLRTKNEKLKSISLSSFVSGLFGVTEPAIYGVTLPRIKMFAISLVGAAIGGALVGLLGVTMYYYSGMGFLGLLGFLNPENPQVLPIIITVAASFFSSFALAFVMFKDDEENTSADLKKKEQVNKEVIYSPVNGQVRPLSESKDDAFASGQLGQGVLLFPQESKIVSPCDGTIRTLFPTNHAIGVVSNDGCEVLIHVGINTVNLEGKYFTPHVAQGDKVKKGQLLLSFDKENLEKEGYSLETPLIITNSSNYLDVVEMTTGNVEVGEDLITVIL